MAKTFKYKGRNIKSIRQRASQTGGAGDNFLRLKGTPRFKPASGDNKIRILPPSPTLDTDKWGDQWGISVWVHDYIGPDNSSFMCPQKMLGKKCKLCNARAELNEEDDEELMKKLRPKKKVIFYIIDRNNEKDGPQIWIISWNMEVDIQSLSEDKDTGAAILLDDPKRGYDFTFEKTGAGLKTRYIGMAVSRKRSPLSEKEARQQKWLEFITKNPLPSLLIEPDPKQMEAALMGKKARKDDDNDDDLEEDEDEDENKDKDDDDDDDEDEKPSKKSKSKSKSKKKSDDDDDDDDDDDSSDDDDDDDEDEKPKKKSKSKSKSKKKSDDDDDDDDDDKSDDDDDDDEDEKPKKKSKSKKKSDDDDDDDDDNDDKDKDDDDDDDDDDEDKKPVKKKGSKVAKKSLDKLKKKKKKSKDDDDDE